MEIVYDKWTVQDMTLSREKIDQIWRMLRRSRTLFSDLTMDDVPNFIASITSPDSMWFEVRQNGVMIGIIWFGELHQVIDCQAHMVFFDRKPAEKRELCMKVVKWMFHNWPLERMTVMPPVMYTRTVRFLKDAGFKQEGLKRRSALIGGRWWDQAMFGITRSEVEALCLG